MIGMMPSVRGEIQTVPCRRIMQESPRDEFLDSTRLDNVGVFQNLTARLEDVRLARVSSPNRRDIDATTAQASRRIVVQYIRPEALVAT